MEKMRIMAVAVDMEVPALQHIANHKWSGHEPGTSFEAPMAGHASATNYMTKSLSPRNPSPSDFYIEFVF